MALPRAKSTESKWAEVRFINGYALFMGFLSMAVRGLGFLVITWTTVVLLGGFVSMLEEKDFWCLTLITLIQITVIQTAGVFDVHTNEKLSYIRNSCQGFYDTMRMMDTRKGVHERRSSEGSSIRCCRFSGIAGRAVTFVVACLQALVFALILCPLGAIYACGLHISGGISLWRLIQHDYGNADPDPSKANMNPALQVLYGLTLVQCVMFSYSMILLLARGKVVNTVAASYDFQGDAVTSVSDYLEQTRTRLAKDPSLSMGRNLITYAVKLMESESPDDYRSGTRILDTIIAHVMKNKLKDALPPAADEYILISPRRRRPEEHKGKDMLMLIERLVASPSSSIIFHKLLKALGSRSPREDDIEIRESSVRIVAHLAGNIQLNQFPRGIECISSLFSSSGQDENNGYKDQVLQGLRIFRELAADQENCRVMGKRNGLVSMIMNPVSSDLLHQVDHHTWSDIVDTSLEVMCCLLTTAPKDTATKLGRQVSNNTAAMESMHDVILDCKDCGEDRHMLAMKILTQLPTGRKGDITGKLGIKKITKMLVSIFCDGGKDSRIRELAGEELVKLSFQGFQSQTVALLQEDCKLVDILLKDRVNKCRIRAAGILEGLCRQYSDEECFQHLKNDIINGMPQVLRQIFRQGSTQAQVALYSGQQVPDIEGQKSVASRANGQNNGQQHNEDKELQLALLSLYVAVYEKLINTNQESALHILDDAFTLPRELEDMARRNSDPEALSRLRMLKLISKMAISMMGHENNRYRVEDMKSLIGALESAAQSMLGLDGFMLVTGRNDGKTLASLVKELDEMKKKTQE